ncbi:MAG: SUF system NifU family Fe-S cluster assembly protein [Actinobacteria bacterium]|nr:SUF system NifU family Fe-S cluster assembly protein [Actinomycetota bacterium]
MPGLDDLYQQLILDHYRKRRNEGRLESPTATVADNNPLCGDEITLDILVEVGEIVGIAHEGQGCSISQASASMMSEAVKGLPADEALELVEHFRRMMHAEVEGDEDRLGDAIALEGVAKYPVRVKCALLSWMALRDAVELARASTSGKG